MKEMMVDAGDGPGASPAYWANVGTAALSAELETMTEFKKRVDGMLQSLDGSDASKPKIAQQNLDQGHLGTGFGESTELLNAYNVVHQNLEVLSQTLSNQIEAMSIALNININGYQNVDDSQRQTLWKIHKQTDSQYNSGVSPSGIVPNPTGTSTNVSSSTPTPPSATSTPTNSGGVG